MNLAEIAQHAGVSKATVSRVLNNKSTVADATAKTVRQAMRELGFSPHMARQRGRPAKVSNGIRTGTVALFFPDTNLRALSTPLSTRLACGVEAALYERNLSMVVTHLRDPDVLPPCLAQHQVDGVIIRHNATDDMMANALRDFPSVWLFESTTLDLPFDRVMPDNLGVGHLACQWLHEQGCSRLGVVARDPELLFETRRRTGFQELAARQGLKVRAARARTIADAVEDLFGQTDRPDGLFIPGDDRCMEEACAALAKLKIRPVDDLRMLACCNDIRHLRLLDPRFANVEIQPVELGKCAVDLLLWRLRNPEQPKRRLLVEPRIQQPGDDAP